MLVAALTGDQYVEGVSLVVHKAKDAANCDALVLLVVPPRPEPARGPPAL